MEDRDTFQRSSLTTTLGVQDALQRNSLTTILEDPVTNAVEMNSLRLSTITPEMAEFVCSNVIKVAAVMTFYLKSCNNRKLDILQNVFSLKGAAQDEILLGGEDPKDQRFAQICFKRSQ